jgi:hypothetical protein
MSQNWLQKLDPRLRFDLAVAYQKGGKTRALVVAECIQGSKVRSYPQVLR